MHLNLRCILLTVLLWLGSPSTLVHCSEMAWASLSDATATGEDESTARDLWNNSKIPVGVTRLNLKPNLPAAPTSQSFLASRYVTDSRQKIEGSCPLGLALKNAACDIRSQSLGRSFDMGADLTPVQTQIAFQDDGKARCHAVLVRPDEIIRLQLHWKCEGIR